MSDICAGVYNCLSFRREMVWVHRCFSVAHPVSDMSVQAFTTASSFGGKWCGCIGVCLWLTLCLMYVQAFTTASPIGGKWCGCIGMCLWLTLCLMYVQAFTTASPIGGKWCGCIGVCLWLILCLMYVQAFIYNSLSFRREMVSV